MLAILDYEAGNQTSVKRALDHVGIDSIITNDAKVLQSAKGIIFPGVGAAGQAMQHLRASGMDTVLKDCIAKNIPLLGICLGCQILLEHSEENNQDTLGILSGKCLRFPSGLAEEDATPVRIPHMGWNGLNIKKKSLLLANVPEDAEFYFVHSYYVQPDKDFIIATTYYGMEFCSIFGRDGLWALQFHVEKSGIPGLQILQNFYAYCVDKSQKDHHHAE